MWLSTVRVPRGRPGRRSGDAQAAGGQGSPARSSARRARRRWPAGATAPSARQRRCRRRRLGRRRAWGSKSGSALGRDRGRPSSGCQALQTELVQCRQLRLSLEPFRPPRASNKVMGPKPSRRRRVWTALIASLGFILAGCVGASGSRLSTAASPVTAPTEATTTSTTAAPVTAATGSGGTAIVGPASTINAAPGAGVSTPPTTVPPLPPPSPSSTRPPPAPGDSGAYGYITAGPTCPVERPDQPCPPRPVVAHIQAQDPSGRDVGATDSDSGGGYLLALPPGTYTLTATTGTAWPHCQPAQVIVRAGSPTRADISCDTGIR